MRLPDRGACRSFAGNDRLPFSVRARQYRFLVVRLATSIVSHGRHVYSNVGDFTTVSRFYSVVFVRRYCCRSFLLHCKFGDEKVLCLLGSIFYFTYTITTTTFRDSRGVFKYARTYIYIYKSLRDRRRRRRGIDAERTFARVAIIFYAYTGWPRLKKKKTDRVTSRDNIISKRNGFGATTVRNIIHVRPDDNFTSKNKTETFERIYSDGRRRTFEIVIIDYEPKNKWNERYTG